MGITQINGQNITASLATSALSASTGLVTTNATFYIPFVDSNNLTPGPEILGTVGSLTYNPSTGQLGATNVTATNFTGTASVASTAIVSTGATNASHYVMFTPNFNAGGPGPSPISESGNCIFNPSTLEFRGGLINNTANGSKTSTADANLTIDASLTQSMTWIASFTTTRSLIVTNLTDGRQVNVWIRNTNATQRQITFSGSTGATGQAISMSAGGTGAVSIVTQNIAATTGTMFVNVRTIGSTTFGTII